MTVSALNRRATVCFRPWNSNREPGTVSPALSQQIYQTQTGRAIDCKWHENVFFWIHRAEYTEISRRTLREICACRNSRCAVHCTPSLSDSSFPLQPKENWTSQLGIIIAVIGSAVGLGNYLRFPGQMALYGAGLV